jgi:uncharacterized membrane protein YtjA (UPF0391 family)
MLRLAIFFFVLAVISGILGFSEMSVVAAGVAKFFLVTFMFVSALCIFLAGRLLRSLP